MSDKHKTCPKCQGSGEVWNSKRTQLITCPTCGGNGYIPINKH